MGEARSFVLPPFRAVPTRPFSPEPVSSLAPSPYAVAPRPPCPHFTTALTERATAQSLQGGPADPAALPACGGRRAGGGGRARSSAALAGGRRQAQASRPVRGAEPDRNPLPPPRCADGRDGRDSGHSGQRLLIILHHRCRCVCQPPVILLATCPAAPKVALPAGSGGEDALNSGEVRHSLRLACPLPSWLRHRLRLVFPPPSLLRHRLRFVFSLPSLLRHRLSLCPHRLRC